jgi:hypothetical protein
MENVWKKGGLSSVLTTSAILESNFPFGLIREEISAQDLWVSMLTDRKAGVASIIEIFHPVKAGLAILLILA